MSTPRRAAQRHGSRRRDNVVLGYCRPDYVDGFTFDSIAALLLHDGKNRGHIVDTVGVESGPRIASSRNQVVRRFLGMESRPEYLYWTDCDMVPPVDIIDRLMDDADPIEKPIVGALCFAGGRTKIVPTIYVIGHNDAGKLESETVLQYPANQLIEIGGTGSACLLIHRSVFERILANAEPDHPLPWYQDVIVDGKDWGEDLIFCLRARAAGARCWLNTGVKVGHRKKWTIDEAAFVRYAAQLDAVAGDSAIQFTDETMPNIEILPELQVVP